LKDDEGRRRKELGEEWWSFRIEGVTLEITYLFRPSAELLSLFVFWKLG